MFFITKKNKSNKICIGVHIYLFYFMYAPLFYRDAVFNNQYTVSIALLLIVGIIFLPETTLAITDMLRNKRNVRFISLIFLSSLYFVFAAVFISGSANGLKELRILQNFIIIVYLLHSLIIVKIFQKKGLSYEEAMEELFKIASFQGVICVLMFLFPPLKNIAEQCFINSTGKFLLGDAYIYKTRIYGLSCDYTYGMPIIQGILTAICVHFSIAKDKKYGKYVPLIFLGALFNSRTGVFVAILASFIALLSNRKTKSRSLVTLAITFAVAIAVLINDSYLYGFISALFDEIYAFIYNHELKGTVEYLVNGLFYFPKGIFFIFGEGHRVFDDEAMGLQRSDVGYSNDMFMGGLIYCFITYTAYITLIKKRENNNKVDVEQKILLISFLVANLKGQATANYSVRVILCMITSIYYLLSSASKNLVLSSKEKA